MYSRVEAPLDQLCPANMISNILTIPMISAAERRIKRRKERYEVEAKRNDVPFFLSMLGVFVIPPLVIILIAYSTGYLDSLSGHYTGTH